MGFLGCVCVCVCGLIVVNCSENGWGRGEGGGVTARIHFLHFCPTIVPVRSSVLYYCWLLHIFFLQFISFPPALVPCQVKRHCSLLVVNSCLYKKHPPSLPLPSPVVYFFVKFFLFAFASSFLFVVFSFLYGIDGGLGGLGSGSICCYYCCGYWLWRGVFLSSSLLHVFLSCFGCCCFFWKFFLFLLFLFLLPRSTLFFYPYPAPRSPPHTYGFPLVGSPMLFFSLSSPFWGGFLRWALLFAMRQAQETPPSYNAGNGIAGSGEGWGGLVGSGRGE